MQCLGECHKSQLPQRLVVVIFGGSGDLARRKIIPAFIQLHSSHVLPPESVVVAVGRTEMTDSEFRRGFTTDKAFLSRLHYRSIPAYDTAGCRVLKTEVEALIGPPGTPFSCLCHLAVPPQAFVPIARGLKESGWVEAFPLPHWFRLIVEKPYGRDVVTSRELNRELLACVHERQLFRIDHYLGKEAVQNLLAFRFANLIFEPLWNNRYIDHVQISAFETVGVEQRGAYYDSYGVARDMMQNHLLQLTALTAMEPPVTLAADDVRNAKVNVLRQIQPLCLRDGTCLIQVRGQYGPGQVVKGYREETDVPPASATETFAALKLFIDNPRWHGVPFYLRSGKRLSRQATIMAVTFKKVPDVLFGKSPDMATQPNRIIFKIQPDEGIILETMNKKPGPAMALQPTGLDFYYREEFRERPLDAYERLLLDALLGDATLFVRSDETELAWQFIDPLIERWHNTPPADFPNYPAGSDGPAAAETLVHQDGREWVDFRVLDGYRERGHQ
jgi:glucose-6-phosphate 1-dehydrogenase